MKPSEILEVVAAFCDEEALKADGFDEACIGIANVFGEKGRRTVLAYDYGRMSDLLVERDGMSYEDAEEYLDFNVLGAYVGEGTPVYIEFIPRKPHIVRKKKAVANA